MAYINPLFLTLPAAIGPSIAETGQKHPFFILIVVGVVILIGGLLGYFGLRKRLKKPPFSRGNS